MKILISIALLFLLSACKNNESNSVNLSENPSDQSNQFDELIDLNPSDPTDDSAIEISSYKVEVTWEHPDTRQDGSILDTSEITEFIIYYGQDANNLDMKVVADPVDLTQTIELPEAGRWYISMSTVDGGGLESELSKIEGINIPVS